MEQLNGAVKEDGTKEQLRRKVFCRHFYAVNALRNGSRYSKYGRLCADGRLRPQSLRHATGLKGNNAACQIQRGGIVFSEAAIFKVKRPMPW